MFVAINMLRKRAVFFLCISFFSLVKIPSYIFEQMIHNLKMNAPDWNKTYVHKSSLSSTITVDALAVPPVMDINAKQEENIEAAKEKTSVSLVKLVAQENDNIINNAISPFPKETTNCASKHNIIIPNITECIKNSVGQNCKNQPEDVLLIQQLLNQKGFNLPENSVCDATLIEAIIAYQKTFIKSAPYDGKIIEGGRTMFHLLNSRNPTGEESIIFRIQMLDHYVQNAAEKFKISPHIIKGIAYHETGGDVSLGLMKVLPIAWAQINRDYPEYKNIDYKTHHTNAEVNINFGAATLQNLKKYLKRDLKVSENHPDYLFLLLTTYNAGPGTIRTAYKHAKTAGEKNPYQALLKEEYMKPAIRSAIYKKEANVSESTVNSKYKEIANYYKKVTYTATLIENNSGKPAAAQKTLLAQRNNAPKHQKNLHTTTIANNKSITPALIDYKRIKMALENNEALIYQPVGIRQTNNPTDVLIVKLLLAKNNYLDFDSDLIQKDIDKAIALDENTIAAIERFQQERTNLKKADKIIDPHGKTFIALVENEFILARSKVNKGKKPIFIGDSIAHVFFNTSGGKGIYKGGSNPKKVFEFVQEAIKQFDLKSGNVYISTGLSNDANMQYFSYIEKQLAMLQAHGISAHVFGVSLTNPKTDGIALNEKLAALCEKYNMNFIGGFNGLSNKDYVHPRYYVIK